MTKKKTHKNMIFKGITFDDWTDNTEEHGSYWVAICPKCKEKYANILGNRVDEFGSGICSVKGCNNEAEHYVDFNKHEVTFKESEEVQMNERITNKAIIIGEVISEPVYSHGTKGKCYYRFNVVVKRLSQAMDIIPVIIQDYLVERIEKYVRVEGHWCSHMKDGHLDLYLFATKITCCENAEIIEETSNNEVYLEGNLCKEPVYRITPQGRRLSDLLIAVNYRNNSSYIPSICWGTLAEDSQLLKTGTHIRVKGRIQSREYLKKYENGTEEIKRVCEFSIREMEVCNA